MKKNYHWLTKTLGVIAFALLATPSIAQHSVAQQWNEALLHAIRNDFARPTIHARNLWHTSIAMYDSWAIYTSSADAYFVGDTVGDYFCPFNGVTAPSNIKAAQEEAMSYAMYRIMYQRFLFSPGNISTLGYVDSLFLHLGYDPSITSTNYATGSPAALGNYIAQELIAFGFQDSSNEQNGYANQFYSPVNPPLIPTVPGNDSISDPNRWQPLTLNTFIDQSGNLIPISTPDFLSPEWGEVTSFALDTVDRTIYTKNGNQYFVYHNPPVPPYIDTVNALGATDDYMWNFRLVSKWSSHLDTNDGVMWDISPNNIGNVQYYPSTIDSLPLFYNENDGGDYGIGYTVNPVTGQPYATQMVRRADYTRVLAEFWADGPDSETPPGHWFTLLNYVTNHSQFDKKWKGQGPILDDLEWDVKAYFTMAGAVHDAAVTAWGIKGYYDYIRPISALRYMAEKGQSSDPALPSYHINGIPLDSGYVELIDSNDVLAGVNYANVGRIKLYAWNGPDSIADPATDMAGVGWILADNWWPYQRPSFVTPPFAGYVSGHSTFSRAAAEVMTFMTGDAYFPGGMGEFVANKNDFLVFEEGPSMTITLQWATYRDASDQCSLSRIWGGIHPPADDIPGRLMGIDIGTDAFDLARTYWENGRPDVTKIVLNTLEISDQNIGIGGFEIEVHYDTFMDTAVAPTILFPIENPLAQTLSYDPLSGWQSSFVFKAVYIVTDSNEVLADIDVVVTGAMDEQTTVQTLFSSIDQFSIEMENPSVLNVVINPLIVSEVHLGSATAQIQATYSEEMDTTLMPVITFPVEDPTNTLTLNNTQSGWLNSMDYKFVFDVVDVDETIDSIDISISGGRDLASNPSVVADLADQFDVDTEKPIVVLVESSHDSIKWSEVGIATYILTLTYNERMDMALTPDLSFPVENPLAQTLTYNPDSSYWATPDKFIAAYDVSNTPDEVIDIDLMMESGIDRGGNQQIVHTYMNVFNVFKRVGFGVEDLVYNANFKVYPNPIHIGSNISISFNNEELDGDVQLIDLQGRIVYSAPFTAEMNDIIQVPTQGIVSGTYLLFIQSDKVQYHTKLIIMN